MNSISHTSVETLRETHALSILEIPRVPERRGQTKPSRCVVVPSLWILGSKWLAHPAFWAHSWRGFPINYQIKIQGRHMKLRSARRIHVDIKLKSGEQRCYHVSVVESWNFKSYNIFPSRLSKSKDAKFKFLLLYWRKNNNWKKKKNYTDKQALLACDKKCRLVIGSGGW